MSTQYNLQHIAIKNRETELAEQNESLAHIEDELTRLMIVEYQHNVGVRGVGAYGSLKEAQDRLRGTMEGMRDRIDYALQMHYLEHK